RPRRSGSWSCLRWQPAAPPMWSGSVMSRLPWRHWASSPGSTSCWKHWSGPASAPVHRMATRASRSTLDLDGSVMPLLGRAIARLARRIGGQLMLELRDDLEPAFVGDVLRGANEEVDAEPPFALFVRGQRQDA